MKYRCTVFLVLFLSACQLGAQLSIDVIGTTYHIDFDGSIGGVSNSSFDASGFVQNPVMGQLDSDGWEILGLSDGDLDYGGSGTTQDFTRGVSTGGVAAGGIYAFQGAPISNRAIGIQPSGSDFTGGSITLKAHNNSGTHITSIDLSYRVYVNNDQPRANSFNFSFSQDGITFHPISALNLTSTEVADAFGFISNDRNISLTGIYIADGDFLYFRWEGEDVSGSGIRDEFALDNISITAQTESPLVFYTQNSGQQSTSINTATQLWATAPLGTISFKQFPLIPQGTYIVQSTHTTTLTASTSGTTINHLTIESGGTLLSTTDPNTPKYISVNGDITCNGTIGNGNGIGSGIAFNLEPGDHLISGTGTFDCTRIRKSNMNGLNGICNVVFDMDVQIHWSSNSGTGIYNNRDSNINNEFNITINPGKTLGVAGDVSLDGTNGNNGLLQWERGGTVLINGTLNCDTIFHKTDNLISSCAIGIGAGGVLNCNGIEIGASGTGGFGSVILDGGDWNIYGSGSSWANFSLENNTIDFLSGSNCNYSGVLSQNINSEIDYMNLGLLGNNSKSIENLIGTQDGLTVQQDIYIGSTANFLGGNWTINIGGDWIMDDALGFTEETSNVVFNGIGQQNLLSPLPPIQFYRLTMNNIAGDLVLNNNIIITDIANFINGKIETGINAVIFEDGANSGGTNNLSYVEGFVRKNGAQNFIFPIGRMGDYRPLGISNLSANSTFEASYYFGDPNIIYGANLEPTLDHISTCEYWILNRISAAGDAIVNLSWDQDTCGYPGYISALADLAVAHWDGSTWLDEGNSVTTGNTLNGTVSSNIISSFSPITLASKTIQNPLPVTMVSFAADPINNAIEVNWVTATEINNDYFEILRQSLDGNLITQTYVTGAGESNAMLRYSWLDELPFSGTNFYYLRQVDFDGTAKMYGPVSAELESPNSWNIQSVSQTGNILALNIQNISENIHLEIFEISGRKILSFLLEGDKTNFEINLPSIQAGVYVLQLRGKIKTENRKLFLY